MLFTSLVQLLPVKNEVVGADLPTVRFHEAAFLEEALRRCVIDRGIEA